MDVLAVVLSLMCLLVTGPAIVYAYQIAIKFQANQTLLLTQQNDILAKMKSPDSIRLADLESKVAAMGMSMGIRGR